MKRRKKKEAVPFNLANFLAEREKFHIARVNITSSYDLGYHTHDYAEIFWVESGTGIHHINEREIPLRSGDIVFIRPSDRHTFSAKGKGLTIVNIAFPAETLELMTARYPDGFGAVFNEKPSLPYSTILPAETVSRLSMLAEEAFVSEKTTLMQDYILLYIIRKVSPDNGTGKQDDLPAWLRRAINDFSSSSGFTSSPGGLAALCGRHPDYINRVLKSHTGKTLSDTIRDIKMRYASTQLSLTTMPIKTIARNCGYANLGHFYKIFEKQYGCTPKQYRSASQKPV